MSSEILSNVAVALSPYNKTFCTDNLCLNFQGYILIFDTVPDAITDLNDVVTITSRGFTRPFKSLYQIK